MAQDAACETAKKRYKTTIRKPTRGSKKRESQHKMQRNTQRRMQHNLNNSRKLNVVCYHGKNKKLSINTIKRRRAKQGTPELGNLKFRELGNVGTHSQVSQSNLSRLSFMYNRNDYRVYPFPRTYFKPCSIRTDLKIV